MTRYRFIDEKGEHLHTLDGKPLMGTTTITGVIAKPLTWWASGLAVGHLGWVKKLDTRFSSKSEVEENSVIRLERAKHSLESLKQMSPDTFLKTLDDAYRAHSTSLSKSAQKGTDMHALLEDYVKAHMAGILEAVNYSDPRVQIFHEWTTKNVKRFLWAEGYCYSEKMWTGGCSDVGAELLDGSIVIIDFKSSKEAYDSHFVQIGGYATMVEENGIVNFQGQPTLTLEKKISQFIVFPFGASKVEPCVRYNVDEYKLGFEACVVLHKILNKNN